MNDESAWESAMSRDFDARVRDLHETPLTLDDVRAKAGSIRRRRRAAVAGGVLAAVAIVVPGALLAGLPGSDDAGPEPVAPAPTAVEEDGIAYLAGDTWHQADGTSVTLPTDTYQSAVVWQNHLVAQRAIEEDSAQVDVITTDGTVVDTFATTGGVAVDEDNSVLAWVDEDGRIMVRDDGDATAFSQPGVDGYLLAVTGGPDCDESADGCRVFTESTAYDSHGVAESPLPGEATVNDARDGEITATDEVSDDGSCGGIHDEAAGRFRVHGCDHTYADIAPGGAYVVGLPSYLSGIGPGRAAILDADDGTELARYDAATVIDHAWIDGSRLLIDAYDYDQGVWRLVVLAADGTVTEVTDPVPGEDLDNAFTLIRR